MSPNEVEITQRMPKSTSAQGACSRLAPTPKLAAAHTTFAGRGAGAAAEIVAGDPHLRIAIGGLVEDEIGILASVVLVALLGEEPLAKAGALDGLEVLLRNDHVGVDIDDLQRRRDAFQRGELVHGCAFPGWSREPVFIAIGAEILGRIRQISSA